MARSYHHGDLRSALVAAGLAAARTGGVEALGLRELTRTVGVTPNAAYRHFADRRALVLAVAVEAQALLARAMLDRMAAIPPDAAPAARALERLRAVGLGYIGFALAEPGWFELAVLSGNRREGAVARPYHLLVEALDALLAAGVITAAQRPRAEVACWSAVHGFADLVTRGPLQHQDPPTIEALTLYVVDTIVNGVVNTPVPGRDGAGTPGQSS